MPYYMTRMEMAIIYFMGMLLIIGVYWTYIELLREIDEHSKDYHTNDFYFDNNSD